MYNAKTYTRTFLAGLLSCSAVFAQDQETDDPPSLSPGEQRVTQSLADQFEDFAGENAYTLFEALRTGSDLSYDVEREIEVEVPVLDADGNPVYQTDADGNPVSYTHLTLPTNREV